jgi:hypothetical protein
MNYDDDHLLSCKLEKKFEYIKWAKEIPWMNFPPHWRIKIIPPFLAAIVRFRVTTDKLKDNDISVYLDCYDKLGCVGQPYWEAYSINGDTERFLLNETDELLVAIEGEIKRREEKK